MLLAYIAREGSYYINGNESSTGCAVSYCDPECTVGVPGSWDAASPGVPSRAGVRVPWCAGHAVKSLGPVTHDQQCIARVPIAASRKSSAALFEHITLPPISWYVGSILAGPIEAYTRTMLKLSWTHPPWAWIHTLVCGVEGCKQRTLALQLPQLRAPAVWCQRCMGFHSDT